MTTFVVSPYSKPLRNGKPNPKSYPYWPELVQMIKDNGVRVIQIGVSGEPEIGADEFVKDATYGKLSEILNVVDGWLSVDNFFQHFCAYLQKPGIVIWSVSDPLVFGYKENLNILKDRKYLRENQFDIWETCDYNQEAFVTPDVVLNQMGIR